MGNSVSVGFIGCGKHARKAHATVIAKFSELFSVKAVYDPKVESVVQFDATLLNKGISPPMRVFSVEDLLNTDIEAVFICAPHEVHLEEAIRALRAGKHVFCEKPLFAKVGETPLLADFLRYAQKQNLVFTSCHPRRFDRVFLSVKTALPRWEQDFGAVREVLFRFFYHIPPQGWKEKDSLLLDHMNHEIDLVNFLLGFSKVSLRRMWDGFDSYAVSGIRDDGVGIYFSGERRLQTKTYRNELEIRFERGRATAHSLLYGGTVYPQIVVKKFEFEDNKRFENNKPVVTTFAPHPYDEAFVGIMKNFHAAIRGEEQNYLDSRSLLENTESCVSLLKRNWYRTL